MGILGLEFEQGIYLGVDFGTTNTVVSVYDYDHDRIQTIPVEGQWVMPTVVQFEPDMEEEGKLSAIFGIEAKEGAVIYPESTVMSVKRLLGRDQSIHVMVDGIGYDFKPEDIVAQFLTYVKELAMTWLHEELAITGEVSGCVLTVPANSTDRQKHRMLQAAVNAGFIEEHVFLRLEPAAAAISYAKDAVKDCRVLVYDFGGGTFDACLLQMSSMSGDEPDISILSTYGDNRLGGDDLDHLMMDMIYDTFLTMTDYKIDLFDLKKDDGVSAKQKKMAVLRMAQAANQAKERLSSTFSAKIVLAPFLQEPEIVNIQLDISRDAYYSHCRKHRMGEDEAIFEELVGKSLIDLVKRTMVCVDKCVLSSGIRHEEVDEIFLVGGSSSLPEVRRQIEEIFNHSPHQSGISPALSISQGAAYYCHRIMAPSGTGPQVQELAIHPLGLEISGRRFLEIIEAGTPIPEEGLRIGAPEPLLTGYDDISKMSIVIYEDTMPPVGNKHLRFVYEEGMKRLAGTTLEGIPLGPKGKEEVQVTFNLSRDNLLTVTAKALSDEGVSTELKVDALYGLS